MTRVVADVVDALQASAARNMITIASLQPDDDEVVQLSGPVIWTRAVLQTLSEATGTEMSYLNFTGMTKPRVFGDVLILPINGFGTGQLHSGSVRMGAEDALILHGWKGSWKHGWSN